MRHHSRFPINGLPTALFLLALLAVAGCRPVTAQPDPAAETAAAQAVLDQFYAAYEAYDTEAMLALHTDDAMWTWIDEGKAFPDFGPEGKVTGRGLGEIGALFATDRGEMGMTGYPLWTEIAGNTITTTELWNNDYGRAVDVPLITRSTYVLRDGKIAEWIWSVSGASSTRFMAAADPLAANAELMTTINDEIWTQFKLADLGAYYADGYVRHIPGEPGEVRGLDGMAAYLTALQTGFPDFQCTIEQALAAGDKVAVRYLCTGTQTGEWMGIPASGKPLEFTSTIIHQLADGKVVEDWVDFDSLGFMQQLGFELAPQQ